ncbi:acyltransferase [Carboxylicivirga sp. M1479]|uniref:acyltransferase n=1 Tax=Carboxylicivirga sp. M1479 TaxID=2594476 RepID=UPI0011788760|nr:acyltransferase [Carboxylicivirga sp. M1479]TRX66348.1 acyltransferase [Carboxylicivirga sp. M1479]
MSGKILHLVARLLNRVLVGNARIALLRSRGVKIGDNCMIFNADFSTEPYLITIGNHVAVSNGVRFITHDGAVWIYRDEFPDLDVFGKIVIGNNTVIGMNAIILPNTVIGDNCIVAAGAVVKGKFGNGSLIMGNPAKKIMDTNLQKRMYLMSPSKFNLKQLSDKQKKKVLTERFKIGE